MLPVLRLPLSGWGDYLERPRKLWEHRALLRRASLVRRLAHVVIHAKGFLTSRLLIEEPKINMKGLWAVDPGTPPAEYSWRIVVRSVVCGMAVRP
jgi:hypothetical protein